MTCAAKPIFLALLMAQIAARPIDPQTVASRARLSDLAVLDLSGHAMRYSKLSGKVTVVAFISTRCPMSNAFNSRLNALYNEFENRVKFVAVNSNANESLDEVRRHAQNIGYDFPVYKDVNNAMADFLGARATPDTFVIDREGYRSLPWVHRGRTESRTREESRPSARYRGSVATQACADAGDPFVRMCNQTHTIQG